MKAYLRGSQDFQNVYRNGNRYDRISMTAFVLPNELSHHRLGITASRKAIGNAVQRNRAKRVLREVFKLSEDSLQRLGKRYDWVLNAKGRILSMKANNAVTDFEQIVESVATREADDNGLQVA
jgi:ribonuclease P protein component